MPGITITDGGTIKHVSTRLNAIGRRASDLAPVMHEIALDMMRIEVQVFKTKGSRGGGRRWVKLTDETVRKKKITTILQTEGASPKYGSLGNQNTLYRSLTIEKAPYQVLKIYKSSLLFGTKRPYSRVHQDGNSARNIPQREFMRFTVRDHSRWNNMIGNYITEPFRR